jgi:hypothetical protein
MWTLRLVCFAYCLVLTFLLLVPDPAAHVSHPLLLEIGGGIGVHFLAFAVLGMLVAGSRLPLRRVLLVGLLLLYGVGVEFLQFPSPLRNVEARDLLQNVLGLFAGVVIWELAAKSGIFTRRDAMAEKARFRVLTLEDMVTYDTFVLADEQPGSLKPGCVLLLHEESGRLVTAHRTRLIPTGDPGVLSIDRQRRSPCAKCGRVEGVVEDQVVCPYHGESSCVLIEAKS